MKRIAYLRPRSVDEARRLKTQTAGSHYIAGGTDLLVRVKNRTLRPEALISLRAIPELSGIEVENGAVRIGALVPLAHIRAHPAVRERCAVLAAAIDRMASVQVRNVATLGGNLCNASPCADTTSPLLVLGARARIVGADGTREVPFESFHQGPGQTCVSPDEILESVLVEALPDGAAAMFLKQGRLHVDLSLASVSVLVVLDGTTCRTARVAASAVAPVPLRLKEVETLLEGVRLTPEVVAHARELASAGVEPIDDVRAGAAYRRHIVGVFVGRALETLAGWRPA